MAIRIKRIGNRIVITGSKAPAEPSVELELELIAWLHSRVRRRFAPNENEELEIAYDPDGSDEP